MEKFNKQIIFEYQPSIETMKMGMVVTEKLGKLNVRMKDVFDDYKRPSRVFAFIESKYSSKIEGIYTTLFENINTGELDKRQNLIKPLIDELFRSKEIITLEKIEEISQILNIDIDENKRYAPEFGIYKSEDNQKIKIYEPPMDKNEVKSLLMQVIAKAKNDEDIVSMIHTHIMYEKVHPFVDGNGRIGRLILQRSISRLMNFANVLPLSQAIYHDLSSYYSAFDINNNNDLDKGIQKILDIVLWMYENAKNFLLELANFVDKNLDFIQATSNKMTTNIAKDILLAIQTKSTYINKEYGLNVKTIDSIFNKLNNDLPFNRKLVGGFVSFWNVELEEIIDRWYK